MTTPSRDTRARLGTFTVREAQREHKKISKIIKKWVKPLHHGEFEELESLKWVKLEILNLKKNTHHYHLGGFQYETLIGSSCTAACTLAKTETKPKRNFRSDES